MKKYLLNFSTESTNNIYAAGISCTEPDYKLCWLLNNTLNTDLTKSDDIVISNKDNTNDSFLLYKYIYDDIDLQLFLISNKNEGRILLDKLKNIDYIFVMKGIDADSQIFSKLKTIESISIIPFDISLQKKIETKLQMLE